MLRALLLLMALAAPARADVAQVVRDHALPGYAAFAGATAALDAAAQGSCDPAILRPAYNAAFDAWTGVAHLRLGPVEEEGRALAISFWPDPKGMGAKAQGALLAGDPAALTPKAMAEQSVAARGFAGLERLLWPAGAPVADPCPLIRATAADLARMAAEISAEWQGEGGFGAVLDTAGQPANTRFLSPQEARQALFTQVVTGLEFIKDQRLGRPLGTFDRHRPDLAEGRAAGRSMANVILSLQAIRDLSANLAPEAVATLAALDRAIAMATDLGEKGMAAVGTPAGRLKVEILQQAVTAARDAALAELAAALDVDLGFNAADGD